jgi:hypothetical protein
MAKKKIDFKDLLLRKGEYIALGVAGFGLVVLLLWGISTGAGAANPAEISKEFVSKANSISQRINDPNDSATPDPLPDSVKAGKTNPYVPIAPDQFASNAILFDVIGRPDTKRKNPPVLGIEEYQVDLVRGAMPGYDIVYAEGKEPLIAVRVEKKIDKANAEKVRAMMQKASSRFKKGEAARNRTPPPQPPKQPGGGSSLGPQPGSGGGSSLGPQPGSGGGSSLGPSPGSGFGIGGQQGNSFAADAQRTEVAISYVPLEQLDAAAAEGKIPAQTVIPLRMIVVNFTIPLKQQMEEVKKALRLPDIDTVRRNNLVTFDGFEVERKISQRRPTGEVFVVQDWTKYDYEAKYMDLIYSRKLRDHLEGTDRSSKQSQYLPYFYRYEDSLVMPLPELVSELGGYPQIRLKSILDTIEKLIAANTPKVDPSSTLNRLQKRGSRKELFTPNGSSDTGADVFSQGEKGGASLPPPGAGNDKKGGNIDNQMQVDIDHLLARFIDCDVQPGLSYEYRIQLRMVNPNFGPANLPFVSNPNDTKKQVLLGPRVPLEGALTVPTEDFLFASDRNQYATDIAAALKEPSMKPLLNALQVKDHQVVVQAVKWMESIRMEGKHEPIGGWVMAEMPVSRGEYVGKKTFVKLPLWSSERNEYVFREIPAGAVKGPNQPKGWLVDFSSRSVLVDFEGGKVVPRIGTRNLPTEEVATEMLIVRPDGKLLVRRSDQDSADPDRKERAATWDAWLKKVETRPAGATGTDDNNPFNRPK